MIGKLFAAACFLLISGMAAAADDITLGALKIEQPWARASAGPVKTGAIYFTVSNGGKVADRLIAANTPLAEAAELHTHLMDGDVMRMRAVGTIEVPPGTSAVLKPGGLHVMLIGLKQPLREGDHVPLSLTFEKAGKVQLEIPVLKPGANPGGHGHGHGHGHHGG